jgi:hypothetical protein
MGNVVAMFTRESNGKFAASAGCGGRGYVKATSDFRRL